MEGRTALSRPNHVSHRVSHFCKVGSEYYNVGTACSHASTSHVKTLRETILEQKSALSRVLVGLVEHQAILCSQDLLVATSVVRNGVTRNDVPGTSSFLEEWRNATVPLRIGGTVTVNRYVYVGTAYIGNGVPSVKVPRH